MKNEEAMASGEYKDTIWCLCMHIEVVINDGIYEGIKSKFGLV